MIGIMELVERVEKSLQSAGLQERDGNCRMAHIESAALQGDTLVTPADRPEQNLEEL